MVLGISDPFIWGVYLLCILAGATCVIYGFINWNRGDEEARPEDLTWVKQEEAREDE